MFLADTNIFLEILLQQNKKEICKRFIGKYAHIDTIINLLEFDFDDAYQYSIAKSYNLTIVTMDKDFKNLPDNDVDVIGPDLIK
ncbi:PIN domain-containing protein [Desulfonema limicola]|uniref:PIN domain-containing protein n=1 Tax=Desulfonema limicola TaxID=45656 RepID=A0A975B5Y1_9BACT|nr:hypothetical protein [Desulfonema limicola]QTA79399.1 PIN domain-containing protein [Desulfonema limicola]